MFENIDGENMGVSENAQKKKGEGSFFLRIAVICWRPYQIFNLLRIIFNSNNKESSKNEYDLYLETLPSMVMMLDSLKESGIFRNIYCFSEEVDDSLDDSGKSKTQCSFIKQIIRKFARIFNFVFCKSYLRRHTLLPNKYSSAFYDDYNYDMIMSSGWLMYFMCMVLSNPLACVHMFEDGLGTYMGDERSRWFIKTNKYNKTKYLFFRFLKKFLHTGPFNVNVSRIYVNRPELLTACFPYEVKQLNFLDKYTLDKIKRIFGYSKPEIYNDKKKIIFLSQNVRMQDSLPEFYDLKMLAPLERTRDMVVIRPHPKYPFTPLGFDVDTSEVSWELLASDLDDCILISNNSAAMFTPNMLYNNKNFTLIFLYKIMNKETVVLNEVDKFIINFKEKINPSIFVPNTFEEYENLLTQLIP